MEGEKLERRERDFFFEKARERHGGESLEAQGVTIIPNNKNFHPQKSSVLFKRLGHD